MITPRVQAILSTADLSRMSEGRMSELMNTTKSTLKRRLGKEGESYGRLLLAERRSRCVVLLEISPRTRLDTLTARCGYLQSQNFTRAFRSWFGFTLSDYRSDSSLVISV